MKQCFLTLLLLLGVVYLKAQTTISGRVLDETKEPIVGASVLITGTNQGTVTDLDGYFKINALLIGDQSLTISSLGYEPFTQSFVGSKNGNFNFSISMKPDQKVLDEVVVVAYGTRKKGDLTGAVTSITSKDFQKGNIASPEQLLTGKVAGLSITSNGGAAGSASKIRIRNGASLNASNEPLVVIDGIPVDGNGPDGKPIAGSTNFLNTINPNDIESISVLKDASATSLYGSRASNGVLIITTKKGQSGAPKFNFNTQLSVGVVAQKVDVLSGDEVRRIIKENGNKKFIELLGSGNLNTDWQDEIYQAAFGADNNLSISGTSFTVPYRVSLGYLNQNGILKTNNFDRFTAGVNLNPKFFDNSLAVNISAKGLKTGNTFADEGAIGNAVSFDPTKPVYDASNAEFGGFYEWKTGTGIINPLSNRNPVSMLELRNNQSDVYRFLGNIQLDYALKVFPDLHFLANAGTDFAQGSGKDIISELSALNYQTEGKSIEYKQKKSNKLLDLSLYYQKNLWKKSSIDVLAGHSYQDFYTQVFNFATYKANDTSIIDGTQPAFKTDKPQYRLESYLGRVNFNLSGKYLFTASIRSDASSKFSKENRVGYFPALAAAWRIDQEFAKNDNIISDLKLRFGWGVTGQQDIGSYYSYLPVYGVSQNSASYQFGSTFLQFYRPSAYDANIKWETTTTTNLGLDFGFLANRITGSIDVYKKETKDLLSTVPVPPGSNFDISLLTNVGNMEVKGLELVINTIPIQRDKLSLYVGFNTTFSKSEITNLLKRADEDFTGIDVSNISGGTGNTIGKFQVGYVPYTFYVYKQVYDEAGKPIEGLYEDLNRDGKLDNSDRYLYANPVPNVLFGISASLNIDKFSIGVAGHASFNNYVYNNYFSQRTALRNLQDPQNFISNNSSEFTNVNFTNNQYLSDLYIENASFFRLDNINFGYNIGNIIHNKANLRLNGSIQNVFFVTKYKGLDPEISDEKGVDNNIYPRPRVFSVGASLDF